MGDEGSSNEKAYEVFRRRGSRLSVNNSKRRSNHDQKINILPRHLAIQYHVSPFDHQTLTMADRYSFRYVPLYKLPTKPKISLTTFSPSGKLAQIEYALAAVGQGLPSLGIRCSNGVVLASEKPHPSILSDQSSFEKISRITPDAGVVYSGMGPDFRVLVDKARKGAHAVRSSCSPVTGVDA